MRVVKAHDPTTSLLREPQHTLADHHPPPADAQA